MMGGSVIELMEDAGEGEGDPEKKDELLGLILWALLGYFSPPEMVAEGNKAMPGVERVLLLRLMELLLWRSKSEVDI